MLFSSMSVQCINNMFLRRKRMFFKFWKRFCSQNTKKLDSNEEEKNRVCTKINMSHLMLTWLRQFQCNLTDSLFWPFKNPNSVFDLTLFNVCLDLRRLSESHPNVAHRYFVPQSAGGRRHSVRASNAVLGHRRVRVVGAFHHATHVARTHRTAWQLKTTKH